MPPLLNALQFWPCCSSASNVVHDLAGEGEECFHGLDGLEVLIDFDDRFEDCSSTIPASPNVRCGDARNRKPVGAQADGVGD